MADNKEKHLLTPAGYQRLLQELNDLKGCERPKVVETVAWAAGNGDRSENGDYIYGKKRLREIDSRIHFLSKYLEHSEIVDPSTIRSPRVRFGASVTVRLESGDEREYTIVGAEESDAAHGKISYRAPIARALLNAAIDDVVQCETPGGRQELEILSIRYGDYVVPQG